MKQQDLGTVCTWVSLGSVTLNESLVLGGPYFVMCKTNPIILGAVRVKRAMYVKSILHWEGVL